MELGIIGLGKMGGNMSRRLMRAGHTCFGWDADAAKVKAIAAEGVRGARSLAELVRAMTPPRAVWIMLPAGAITDQTVTALARALEKNDVVIDGGNSFYQDDLRHAAELRPQGIHFIDCGTSGGVWGLERGYCLMIGGEAEPVRRLDPIFRALAPGRGDLPVTPHRENRAASTAELGYLHCGPVGSGHFVKMVHNGIEYGMMQAYAEGLQILHRVNDPAIPEARRYQLDLADVTEVWRRGSVIASWLLDLTASALAQSPDLSQYSGTVADSGEGRWTIQAAIEESVPATVLSHALYNRFRSREEHNFADKLLSAMRAGFGGHIEIKSGD